MRGYIVGCARLLRWYSLTDLTVEWHAEVITGKYTYASQTRICAAEMAVRYAALSACRKVHVCHCNSLGGAT